MVRAASLRLFEAFWPSSHSQAWFVRTKANADPLYAEVLLRTPADASLLDVGGGQGILTLLHSVVHGGDARRTVVDWDAGKVALGRQAAAELAVAVDFVEGDVHALDLAMHDAVVCADVLHYARPEAQDALLRRLAECVAPGGLLLVREIDGAQGWRRWMTWFQERFSLLVGLTRADGLYIRAASELCAVLEAAGLEVVVEPAWAGTPFANVLILARRPRRS